MSAKMGKLVTRKMMILFRDKLVKHLLDMKDHSQVELIDEVYRLLTELTDTMED